jgi:dihydroorotate dehydrogenase (NAD+) catalytic subunit
MTNLRVKLGELEWPTPVALASGTCGYGEELEGLVDWSAVGAIFTKGISLEPRRGHPPPRIWETASGMLNAIGLENVGIEAFLRDKMPFLREWRTRYGGRVIVNLYATSADDYRQLARRFDEVDGVDGLEVNLSCPNVKEGGITFGATPEGCALATAAVREATHKWVAVKLSPASPIAAVARASRDAGADALSTGNTMPAMAIDIEKRTPRISAGAGGLSGPALRPVNLRMTYEAAQAVDLPLVGSGGVTCGADAVEYLLAGASAVQVGTATFSDPNAAGVVRDGLVRYLEEQGETSVQDLVGGLSAL